jgi:hypothetical protein
MYAKAWKRQRWRTFQSIGGRFYDTTRRINCVPLDHQAKLNIWIISEPILVPIKTTLVSEHDRSIATL